LEGLGKDFIYALNLLSTRLGCRRCGKAVKVSCKHYDKQHCQTPDMKSSQTLTETFRKAHKIWLVKRQVIAIRCQSKQQKLNEKQARMIRELKMKKEQIKNELKKWWRSIYSNILTII